MIHCFKCGADLPDNMAYCLHCGSSLDKGPSTAFSATGFSATGFRSQTTRAESKKISPIAIGLAIAAILLGGGIIAYFAFHEKTSDPALDAAPPYDSYGRPLRAICNNGTYSYWQGEEELTCLIAGGVRVWKWR